jgi:inner membrane protein
MYRTGHYGMALLVYAPVGFSLIVAGFEALALTGGAIVVSGAMIPDLDQRIPGIRHRGLTHTIWFALAVGLLLGAVGVTFGKEIGQIAAIALGSFGLGIGILTTGAHLLADALTPAGIQPFAPLTSTSYSLHVTTAANPIANYLLFALGLVATGVALFAADSLVTAGG